MSDKTLKIERIIKASPERIWRCWAEPRLLEQWYCPKPWFVKILLQELHAGGRFQLQFVGPNSEGFSKSGLILECIPNKKMVFTDAFVEAWEPSNRALHVVSFELEDLGDGTTKYIAQTKYWNIADAEEQRNNGYVQGSNMALNQLEELLETLEA